jgi:Domain of unknown function (DUF4157)
MVGEDAYVGQRLVWATAGEDTCGPSIWAKLGAEWREPFEWSFQSGFAHVSVATGPVSDRLLASTGAIAMAIDDSTILLSSQSSKWHNDQVRFVVGHELAHTVQLSRGGSDSVCKLEAEAWSASSAALRGERYTIKGRGATPLFAAGLYLTDAAKEYFETFGIPPLTVPKGKTARIKPETFESIMDLMLVKFQDEEDFVIQAHGQPSGFALDITTGQNGVASQPALISLRKIVELRSELTAAGNDLDALKKIVKTRLGQEPAVPDDPKNPVSVARAVGENRQKVEAEIDVLKKQGGISDEAVIARIVKKMQDLKQKQRNRIELRTCNMGRFQPTLDFFRELFNAKILRAPDHFSAFGHFTPPAPRNQASYDKFLKAHGRNFPYRVSGGQFIFDFIGLPNFEAQTPSAATCDAAAIDWAREYLGSGGKVEVNKFPIHFLTTDPPAFPQETRYKDRIKQSPALNATP